MEIRSDALIAVVGAGTMGAGIAQVAASAGHAVQVIDSQAESLKRGQETVAASLASQVRRGAISEQDRAAIEGRIRWSADIADAAGAALAIEAIVERLDAKIGLFGTLARHLSADALLASNTSSLPIEAMAEAVPHPERFIGLHFFNPVPAMKLVEVVPATRTAPSVVEASIALMRAWGKRPVPVRDVPGFIVNRVARPYYAEGFAAFGEGVDAAAIDHALTASGGFRMGPLALADMIGQDINYSVARSVFDAYDGKTRFRPQRSQAALAEGGDLGRKTGRGVYDYTQNIPAAPIAGPGPRPVSLRVPEEPGLLAPLIDAAISAGIETLVDSALTTESLSIDGVLLVLGDGRRLAERAPSALLLDYARDFAGAKTLVMTALDNRAAAIGAGFAQAIGRDALFVPDRPGQIVLRTLAQLANAAADAVADQVADAACIDEAMMFGANHPDGPLSWAKRVGTARVATALANLAAASGDAMYAPAAEMTGL